MFFLFYFSLQDLLKVYLDCDSDTLKFVVRQQGQGFCHLNTWTCFGESGRLPSLMRTLISRKQSAPPGSYTDRLYKDSKLLHAKIREEAEELCEAESKEHIAAEAADVLYFSLVKCAKAGKQPQYPHAYSPHCSPYMSCFTSWENLINHQRISCLVIICFILMT